MTIIFTLPSAAQKGGAAELLIASDVHFNPMYDSALVEELLKAEPEDWEAILNRSQPRAFSPYGQDTNWWLLHSALGAMHNTTPKPAVFIITGDLLAHGLPKKFQALLPNADRQQYRTFVRKTVQFIALELRKRWPNTQILLTPGNNDDMCGDYAIAANGEFLDDTAETVRELAKADEEMAADWKALGSYSVRPPTLNGLELVSVNTIFFSKKYTAQDFQKNCASVQTSAPSDTFAWLQDKLASAQEAKRPVWLMMHIPPGIDGYASTHPSDGSYTPASCANDVVPLWAEKPDGGSWTTAFDSLLTTYARTVVASFAGHTHTDDFRVLGGNEGPKQFVLIDPPISPVYMQNPAFRVVQSADGALMNQTTYYLADLQSPNPNLRGKWRKEYDFRSAWKSRRPDAKSLGSIYAEITSDSKAREKWLKFWTVSSAADKNAPDTIRGLYCAIEALGLDEYRRCACAAP